ncbi:MAG TPA: ribosome rescue protein RqcH [Methanomassiliicoccales archaeon]|nr:ribosome rescue protein RqcH [Methanomassiliicoccales archaeon]
MKNEMRAFDVLAVVSEAQSLIGGFVDKIFQWDGGNVLIRVNVKGEAKKELFLKDGKWFYLAPQRPQVPDFPDQFAVHLRKLISNARIESVRQVEFDRIVVIDIMRGEQYQLVVELFGEGNLLLVKDGKIVNCLFSRRWRHREVRPGAEYLFPPKRFNPLESDLQTFISSLKGSTSDAVRTLATSVNLGGQYAEEVCLRAGVDKGSDASSLSDDQISGLYQAMVDIIKQVRDSSDPRIVFEGEDMLDITPVPLVQYSESKADNHSVFSEALHEYLVGELEPLEITDKTLLKLQRQLEHQKESIEKRKAEAVELSSNAELLYMNYQQVNDLLNMLKSKMGSPWEDIISLGESKEIVRSVDPSKHRVSVLLDGNKVSLDYEKSIDANANLLYDRAKELREKAKRAEEALQNTEARIGKRKKGLAKEEESRGGAMPTKQFWFERYKWFLTSSGKLVIAGRDARTNDQVVKKHLKSEDRYAHADVHGAPSVVFKEGSEAQEDELREVCIFALAHSKAWNAGVKEGSAYWVLPDQVSKAPMAGEFVPRGGFIIRGKRNYFHHILMEMVVGEISYQGERKIMGAPRKTMESMSERYVIIGPGKTERSKISSKLARKFEVPEEEISRILPPGDLEIIGSTGIQLEE